MPFACACSNESLNELTTNFEKVQPGTRTLSSDTIAVFGSEAEFAQALKAVSALQTEEEKVNWVKEHYGNFQSMQALYDKAMEEAADLGETKEEYLKFKTKYNSLYFPMYKEDGGYYIPLRNLNSAYLVNANGNISIDGNVRNKKDITTYQELMDLDRAYYVNDKPATMAAVNYDYFTINPDVEDVGSTWDSDWRERADGKRKVKLKVRRRIVSWNLLFHTEVAFRKHTWLGWANYKSDTKVDGTATVYVSELNSTYHNMTLKYYHEESGKSSHDGDTGLFIYRESTTADRFTYLVPRLAGKAQVYYQAMGNLDFEWGLPPVKSNFVGIMPFRTPVVNF